jgi:hypothetical protein
MFWRSVGVPQASPVEVRAGVSGAARRRRGADAALRFHPVSRDAASRPRACVFLATATHAQALLDRNDCTLEALLAEDELIQELKSLNSRVINLCARPRARWGWQLRTQHTLGLSARARQAKGGIGCAAVSPPPPRRTRVPHAAHGAAAARRGGVGGVAAPAARLSADALPFHPRCCLDSLVRARARARACAALRRSMWWSSSCGALQRLRLTRQRPARRRAAARRRRSWRRRARTLASFAHTCLRPPSRRAPHAFPSRRRAR